MPIPQGILKARVIGAWIGKSEKAVSGLVKVSKMKGDERHAIEVLQSNFS